MGPEVFSSYLYLRHNPLDPFETKILQYLSSYSLLPNSRCYPAQKTIAEHAEISDRKVRQIIESLKERGIIVVKKSVVKTKVNQTCVNEYEVDYSALWNLLQKAHSTTCSLVPEARSTTYCAQEQQKEEARSTTYCVPSENANKSQEEECEILEIGGHTVRGTAELYYNNYNNNYLPPKKIYAHTSRNAASANAAAVKNVFLKNDGEQGDSAFADAPAVKKPSFKSFNLGQLLNAAAFRGDKNPDHEQNSPPPNPQKIHAASQTPTNRDLSSLGEETIKLWQGLKLGPLGQNVSAQEVTDRKSVV